MSIKKPLVLTNGQLEELQNGDTIVTNTNYIGVVTEGLELWLDGSDFSNDPPTPIWLDRSPNGRNANARNFAFTSTSGSNGLGGVVFNGSSLFQIDSSLSFKTDQDDFTFETYIDPYAVSGGYKQLVTSSYGSNEWFFIRFNNAGTLELGHGSILTSISSGYAVHVPIHLVVIKKGNTITIYVNGMAKSYSTITLSSVPMNTGPTIGIGAWYGGEGSEFFVGAIYFMRIYNRALTDREVRTNYYASYFAVQDDVELDNGIPSGGTAGNVLVKNSATDYDTIWSYPIKNRIYYPSGTNLGYDDEFEDGSLDVTWSKIDYGLNNTDWYEVSGVKGLSFQHNNITTDKCSGLLKSIDGLSEPFYIEAALIFASQQQVYPALGLLLSTTNVDGTGYQADGAIYESMYASTVPQITSVVKIWSNFSSVVSDNSYSRIDAGGFNHEVYLRLAFASNTVYLYTSVDGVVWKLQGSHAWAYTPAYAGLYLQRGVSYAFQGQFKYFRVRSGTTANG